VYLHNLHAQHFRNLAEQTVSFSPGFNYLYGANGAGKTALLEGIYVLARGRSFRTAKTSSLISSGQSQLVLRGEVVNSAGYKNQLAMLKSRSGRTELRVNGKPESRASALAKHLPVLTLLPQAAELVLGGPAERRGFLDWGVFHVEQRFVDVSRNYRRALTQRNAWLKSLHGEGAGIEKDPWLRQLLEFGNQVSEMRAAYTEQFLPCFSQVLARLSPGLEVQLTYDWGGMNSASEGEKKLGESWSRDVKFGMTHRGPHRSDLRFTIDDQVVSDTVSRGQAKLISSAAILAQAELLYQHSKTKSLILIDDFGAELDADHWRQFLNTLLALDCQVIATSTGGLDLSQTWVGDLKDLRVFHVKQGRLEQQS